MVFNFLKRDDVLSKWNQVNSTEAISQIEFASHLRPQLIFKHSTRCSISNMAFDRINAHLEEIKAKSDIHYVDVLRNRNMSDAIAKRWNIIHESPQILIIKNGEVVYHASHSMIQPDETINQL